MAQKGAVLDNFGAVLDNVGVVWDKLGVILDNVGNTKSLKNRINDAKNRDCAEIAPVFCAERRTPTEKYLYFYVCKGMVQGCDSEKFQLHY